MLLVFRPLEALTEKIVTKLIAEAPAFRREKALRHKSHGGRARSIGSFCLLCVALGYIPQSFRYGQYGKPGLGPGQPAFNISHSKDCLAVVTGAEDAHLGVDIETLREPPYRVMRRVFTDKEKAYVEAAKDPVRAFFTMWTLKEGYIKAIGRGLGFPFKEVSFVVKPGGNVHCSDPDMPAATYAFDGMQASVLGDAGQTPREISLPELLVAWGDLLKK